MPILRKMSRVAKKAHFVTENFRLFHLIFNYIGEPISTSRTSYLVKGMMSLNTGVRHSDCCGQAVRYHLPDRLSWALWHRLVDSHHYGGHAGIRPGHIHIRVGITLRIQHETPAFQKRSPVLTLQDLLAGLRSPFQASVKVDCPRGLTARYFFIPFLLTHH